MKKILLTLLVALSVSTITFSQKTWDGSSSVNWNTAANWTPSGVPTASDAVIIPNGLNVTVNTTAVCASFTINSGGNDNTITISSGQSLTVSGAVSIGAGTGSNDDKIIAVGSATLSCASITMDNTGGATQNCEITISTGTVNVTGDITMNGASNENAIRFSGAGTLNIGGDVASGGDFVPSSTTVGLVNYNGTSGDQTVKSDTYADITFSGGATKTLSVSGIIVTDVATFTNGIVISTAANTFTFNNNATVSGPPTNDSYVDGPVIKLGNDNFTFPTGDPLGSYHPIALDNSVGGGATGDSYTAEYFRASALTKGPIAAGSGLYGVSNCEYWQLTKGSGSGTPSVSVSWTADSPCSGPYVSNLTGLTVAWLNGSNQWQVAPGTGTNNNGTTTAGTSQRTGISNFGFFALGNLLPNGSPLPVKFGTIKAYEKQQGIQIDWIVYAEENVLKYQVEHSTDGINFQVIGEVTALNVTTETKYSFFDSNPNSDVNFYRIRNIDIDSKSGFTSIVKVNLNKSEKGITIYPNPVSNGVISFQGSDLGKGNYSLRIFNAFGQQLYMQHFSHGGGAINQTIQLPANVKSGMYTMLLTNESARVMSREFIVQ